MRMKIVINLIFAFIVCTSADIIAQSNECKSDQSQCENSAEFAAAVEQSELSKRVENRVKDLELLLGRKLSEEEKVAIEADERNKLANEEIIKRLDKINAVTVSVSLGPRVAKNDQFEYHIASDTTLQRDKLPNSSFIISTQLNIFPFANNERLKNRVEWLKAVGGNEPTMVNRAARLWANLRRNTGMIVNLNLIELSGDNQTTSFNKGIDGGIGIGYRLSDQIFIGYSWEWFTQRNLRGFYQDQVGNTLSNNGSVLTSLDQTNDELFFDNRVTGRAFKIAIKF